MFFDSLNSFIEMGGHGPYVWLCYGIFAVIMITNFLTPSLTRKNVIKDIERQIRREQK
ncbi:heme exporter protein CcmD [Bermanella marisrubri]|uniref:Heme exporter protein D n=1 Tax=Bermanella marisrubri TaxID=207949 RepID=Q1N1Q3_9GAMM|nr:heme exporter protein CcmD [Bermanella marisrubri]EAT12228.1 Heme exporter protein D [Oceanobacter sp. RED65] [Bermanella marisrubri]QIZ83696.1 heme exporter protein CcmD [Bermanella marisrubri]